MSTDTFKYNAFIFLLLCLPFLLFKRTRGMTFAVILVWLVPLMVVAVLHARYAPRGTPGVRKCVHRLRRMRGRWLWRGVLALAVLGAVRTAADIMALHVQRAPTGLTVPVDVNPLVVHGRAAPTWFHHFNPSVASVPSANGTSQLLHVAAVREASLHNCPAYVAWLNPLRFLHVSSRIVLAVAEPGAGVGGPFRACSVLEKRERTPHTLYQGIDDARIFVYSSSSGTPQLGATIVINNHMFVSRFEVHVRNDNDNGEIAECSIRETHRAAVHVAGTPRGTKEKNWMHVPDSGAVPRFVQRLNPLTVVALDLASGEAAVVSRAPVRTCVPRGLRGSTNLLPHPTRAGVFIGLAHEKVVRYPPIVIAFFTTRVVAVEAVSGDDAQQQEDEGGYRLIGMSSAFRLPAETHATTAHRIQYPMSLAYADSTRATISIAMGYMDCTAHTLDINTTDLLSLLQPLDC